MRPSRFLGVVTAAATLAAVVLFAHGAVLPVSRPFLARGPGQGVRAVDGVPPGTSSGRPEVARDVRHDLSPPLRTIRPVPAPPGWAPREAGTSEEERLRPAAEAAVEAGPAPRESDPVIQRASVGPRMPLPTVSFDGIAQAQQMSMGYWAVPPDTIGDIGPNHYVQAVNTSFAVFDRSGTTLYGPAAINSIWSGAGGVCQNTNDGDPVVVYDELADRWLISQFALPNYPSGPFYQCIAISQTANPTGSWHRYTFQMSANKLNDYPKFGVWPDGYYLSVNQFQSGSWAGARVAVFERSEMLNGNSAQQIAMDLYSVDPNLGGMLPADLDGDPPPAGAPALYAQFDESGWGYPQDQLELWAFDTDWATPANSTFTKIGNVAVAAVDTNLCNYDLCIGQPGTSVKLDPLSDRLMWRLQYRNFGSHQTLVTSHAADVGSNRAGVRWYELRNSGSGWGVQQQGTFAPDLTSRWMSSAAMNDTGDLAIGYSVSSTTADGGVEPGLRYAGRLVSDPANTLGQGEAVLRNGGGHQTDGSGRWGDYSSMNVDPTDGCTFWYTSMYYSATSVRDWRTRIGAFRLPGCGAPPPPDTTPPTGAQITVVPSGLALSAAGLSWSATDDESGVDTYDVLVREAPYNGDFGLQTTWRNDTPGTSANYPLTDGTTACFSITATDNAANTSAPSSEECVSAPVDDATAMASGPWKRSTAAGHYLDTVSRSKKKGSTLTLSGVEAGRLWVVADKCRGCGRISVRWNGSVVARLDLDSRRTKPSRVFAVASMGTVQTGTLQIKVTSRSLPVKIDGIGVAR